MNLYDFYKLFSTLTYNQKHPFRKETKQQSFSFIIIMLTKLIIFFILPHLILSTKEPILELPLTLTGDKQFQTTFALGTSQVRVTVDISFKDIEVCCKNKETLPAKIYYFMLNPFRIHEDYRCQSGLNKTAKDIAKFSKLGPLTVNFTQLVYPFCRIGKLGLSKKSTFLAQIPQSERYFIIQSQKNQNPSNIVLKIGGQFSQNFILFQKNEQTPWTASFQHVSFNGIDLDGQKIAITSDSYQMLIPSRPFLVIRRELLKNFECIQENKVIYCPCNEGISHSFPSFTLTTKDVKIKIEPNAYLMDFDEICKSVIKETSSSIWSVNLQMLSQVDLMFHYDTGQVAMLPHRMTIKTSNSINQPLQIILNSVVILLMCLFVAMILIELIKHVTGIQNASSESFQSYMMKRSVD